VRGRQAPLLLLLGSLSCGDAEKGARDLADKASAEADKLAKDAKTVAQSQLDGAASAASDTVISAKAKIFDLPDLAAPKSGALSDQGLEWLAKQKPAEGSAAPGGIEGVVARGAQIAPVVIEAKKVMNQAVDEDTAVEPIYQAVEPGQEPVLDQSIKDMPRVEVVDGFTIGFKKLDAIETTKIHKEQAALVMWRKDGHLVGFLYRSRRTIDMAVVVKETPRLLRLMHAAAN